MTDQLAIVMERLETLQKSINRIDKDLEADRKDVQETRIRLGAMEGEVAQLSELVRKLPSKVGDRVDDALEPITDVLDQVEKKPFWVKMTGR